jgi:hypothetical protein
LNDRLDSFERYCINVSGQQHRLTILFCQQAFCSKSRSFLHDKQLDDRARKLCKVKPRRVKHFECKFQIKIKFEDDVILSYLKITYFRNVNFLACISRQTSIMVYMYSAESRKVLSLVLVILLLQKYYIYFCCRCNVYFVFHFYSIFLQFLWRFFWGIN